MIDGHDHHHDAPQDVDRLDTLANCGDSAGHMLKLHGSASVFDGLRFMV
jgi:hypothetical protein